MTANIEAAKDEMLEVLNDLQEGFRDLFNTIDRDACWPGSRADMMSTVVGAAMRRIHEIYDGVAEAGTLDELEAMQMKFDTGLNMYMDAAKAIRALPHQRAN